MSHAITDSFHRVCGEEIPLLLQAGVWCFNEPLSVEILHKPVQHRGIRPLGVE